MDYRKFLSPTEPVVLPYFGGTRVDAAERRFRLEQDAELAPGWWRFKIDGRRATPVERAPATDLGSLPIVRGHFVSGWVVVDGRHVGHIPLPLEDEPAALSRVVARRWYSGDLLFDTLEFEDDAEIAARDALEQRRPLGELRGVPPSLRAAFGYALGLTIAEQLRIDVSMRELTPHVVAIADGGREATAAIFNQLVEQRRRQIEEARLRAERAERERTVAAEEARLLKEYGEQYARVADAVVSARARERHRDPRRAADEALDAAGARMLSCRRVASNTQLDITYEVDGTRIMSIVDVDTLQVLDPGICLSGAHGVLTLDAMPSVVREAIEEEHLNITRR